MFKDHKILNQKNLEIIKGAGSVLRPTTVYCGFDGINGDGDVYFGVGCSQVYFCTYVLPNK